MSGEVDKLRALATNTAQANRLIHRFERIADEENASAPAMIEAAAFILAKMLSQSNVPLILWRIHANRIEKKLVPDDRLRRDDQAHRPERPRDTAVARPCRGVPRQVRKSLSLRP